MEQELDPINCKMFDPLPSPLPVTKYIVEMLEKRDLNREEILNALKLDPALAAQVIRLANSSVPNVGISVSSLKNAINLLGLERIFSLLEISLILGKKREREKYPISIKRFWAHSLLVALISESIGKFLKRYQYIETDILFCAGLLHDIGKLVLCTNRPQELRKAVVASTNKVFFHCEDCSCSHVSVGAFFAEKCFYPPDLCSVISSHHAPEESEGYVMLGEVVHIADNMAHVLGYGVVEKESVPEIKLEALKRVNLQGESLRVIASTALEHHKRIRLQVDML
ncbi:HDOD domain-containing protein [Chitinispirillales bacterium ANBcel5]|uniref:HDOD domain-containing protein n=1 Tax=Cellulosispirillum alkaliphilum TaxID=3039283 RepID=UPI002A531757|nr:HDOD domain-containing protein [Chitinispirillales bacterium ANBcel5]